MARLMPPLLYTVESHFIANCVYSLWEEIYLDCYAKHPTPYLDNGHELALRSFVY